MKTKLLDIVKGLCTAFVAGLLFVLLLWMAWRNILWEMGM